MIMNSSAVIPSSDILWSFFPLWHCIPLSMSLQLVLHPSHCSPQIMFNSPPALLRLTSPCVIPLSALCFRLVLITATPHHARVWN